jgi:hypothetical protein
MRTLARTTGLLFLLTASAIGFVVGACGSDGENGKDGVMGGAGAAGPQGPAGTSSPAVDAGPGLGGFTGACTKPCHTFNGVVDQWRFSNHSHPQNNEIGGGACGNCHAIDGLQNRVGNNYVTLPDSGAATDVAKGHTNYRAGNGTLQEISYGGASTIGRIHCTTCHDFNPTNDPHATGKYVAGQAPLRVPGGAADTAFLEKSPTDAGPVTGTALAYGSANTCIFCHKSRKDVTYYVTNTTTLITSYRWGPHEGPQADLYSGQGAYQFAGKTYGNSEHITIAKKCVGCHMAPVATNDNVPDHTMKPTVATCTTGTGCHTQYTGKTFDVLGGQTTVKKAIFEMQAILNAKGWLTRSEVTPYPVLTDEELADGQFQRDIVKPGNSLTPAEQGALYNYLVIARGKDFGAHNPRYTKQVLYDSIELVKPGAPASGLTRPQ